MIEVYNYALSPCGEKVRFALAEKGLTWIDRPVDLGTKENLRPDFLRISPKGLVPVLAVDGTPIVESSVINEYIDDSWPEPPLRPLSPRRRATMRMWTKHVDEVLHPAWPGIAWPILVRPVWLAKGDASVEVMLAALLDPARRERQRHMYRHGLDAPESRACMAILTSTCDLMELTLAQDVWLAGPDYSLADIALLPYLFTAELYGLQSTLERGRPALGNWYRRCCARPAFRGNPRSLFDPVRLAEVEACGRDATALLQE